MHLADGVALLHPEEQVFEAMLDGWRNQQLARNLAPSTINQRATRLRVFLTHADAFPWHWAQAYPRVLAELLPTACHVREKYANNPIEADHGRLKSRLQPMRGLTQLRRARVISAGHAFVQNLRRGHYKLRVEEVANLRVLAAFDELTLAI